MQPRFTAVLVTTSLLVGSAMHLAPAANRPPRTMRWIWSPEGNPAVRAPSGKRYFRKSIKIPAGAKIKQARFMMTVDDGGILYCNGAIAAKTRTGWNRVETVNLRKHIKPGRNVVALEGHNSASAAGFIGWLDVRCEKGQRTVVATDRKWRVSARAPAGWATVGFDDSSWPLARELGPVNSGPWANKVSFDGTGIVIAVRRGEGPVDKEEARKLIESDWIHQADGLPTPARSLREIGWARALAQRLAIDGDGGLSRRSGAEADPPPSNAKRRAARRPNLTTELAELARLETELRAMPPDDWVDEDSRAYQLYLAVRRVKRRIMFANPLVDFDRLLLVDTPAYAGVHESAHRNGYHYGNRGGSRLLVLDGLRPDAAERVLVPPETGYIMRMDLSFDAEKVVFGMKPANERSFHLYEVGIDGKELQQLTSSPYDDMDPIYLPDGRIMFSTSRGHTYVRCLPQSASTVLARCDADGKNIYIVSRNNEPDYTPSLLPDGRVLYTRWEYTERPLWRLQKLWTINPDGTGLSVYWGNASAHPDVIWEARAIPGTTKVIFAAVGHHNVMTGCLGIVDVSKGLEYPHGISKITADLRWPESGDSRGPNPVTSPHYHAGGRFWSYRCPYPLGPEDFLVSAARDNNGRFDLYLMDIHGNRELIYVGHNNSWYARPLRPRPKPAHRPDRVEWPAAGETPAGGSLFSADVYEGVEGLPRGKARYLRVIQMDAKTYSSGFKSWRHSGPAISVIQEDGVKRILGTVPIAADGSVSFKVPAGKALHFQLLDEHRRCIQIMRSFTGVMPGESRGCVGCHAMHHGSPQARPDPGLVRRAPAELTPPPWGADVSVSYERFCQPILDKYCGKCHQGNGKGRKKLDLTLRGGVPERGVTDPKQLPFKEPYLTLVGQAWSAPPPQGKNDVRGLAGCMNVERNRQYGPLAPMTMLSSTSPLITRVMSGKHNGVKIEGSDLLKLIAWVDCNCVYRGDEEVRQLPDPNPGVARRFPVPPRIRTAPRINRLSPVSDTVAVRPIDD